MKVFLLSILAIGSVQSLTIGYPYRSGYWSYNPARGEFPVQSSVVQSYLRYIDNSGNERIIGYSYPEPVYGQRQISVSTSPVYRTYTQSEFSEFNKARDAHFRVWSLQQYQVLKREIDALRAQGKEPSSDMMLKFRPLEKIALTEDFTTIAELPEIKRVREEHLQIWNKARVDNLQTNTLGTATYQQSSVGSNQGELKTYNGQSSTTLVSLEETPEQKQAREDHLRIYNEQIASLRQLELEHQQQQQKQQNTDFSLRTSQSEQQPIPVKKEAKKKIIPNIFTGIGQQSEYTGAINELERAKQEHFRLWNEAKLRAEQSNVKSLGNEAITSKDYESADRQQISTLKQDQIIQQQRDTIHGVADIQKAREDQLRVINEATLRVQAAEEQQKLRQQQPIGDTADVIKAREEHLRLVNEAKLRVEQAEQQELKHKTQNSKETEKADEFQLRSDLQQDPADHLIAREEHLRLVQEATLKIQAAEEHIKQLGAQQFKSGQIQTESRFGVEQQQLKSSSPIQQHQVVDTPDVVKAREEHLRLVNEAKLRVEQAEQQELKTKPQPIKQTEKVNEFNLRSDLQNPVDHLKAREEHLRLVNEATLKIQAAEEHIKQLGAQQLKPNQIQTESRFGVEQQQLKSSIAAQQQQVVDTPEVIKAREEHLRILNEANKRAEQAEQQEFKHEPQAVEQPTQFAKTVTETKSQTEQQDSAEHSKAREEHLRLVNEATLKIQAAEEHIKQLSAQQVTPGQIQTESRFGFEQQEQQHLKSTTPVGQQQQHQVVDTPEVMKAREEHLRILNEANLRAQSVEQQELKYKQENKQESQQVPLLKSQALHHQQHHQQVYQAEQPQDTPAVIKAREDHLRLINKASGNIQNQNTQYYTEQQSNLKSHLPQQYQKQQQVVQQSFESPQHIGDTPEVIKAREEHLRIFNAIKSHNEQEESKMAGFIKSNEQQLETISDAEQRLLEEKRILELQGLREAEHLQEEHKKLEYEGMREAERLAEEQRKIEAELIRLKIEEQKRLELEDMLEAKRLAEEQQKMAAELQRLKLEEQQRLERERILEAKRLKKEEEAVKNVPASPHSGIQETFSYKQTQSSIIPSTKSVGQTQQVFSQQQHHYSNNPYLRANPIKTGVVTNRLQHSFNQQQQQHAYTSNPFLKTSVIKAPIVYYPVTDISSSNSAIKTTNTIIPVVRYVQSSQPSNVHKHQHIKDDFVKTKYSNTASSQPTDTAEALIALERATNEHFRAHELALEQLRLARLQNPKFKDCN